MQVHYIHFAFGASIPFVISLFFTNRRLIFIFPFIMTAFGIFAMLPHYFGWSGAWTNMFVFYDVIEKSFVRFNLYAFFGIIVMFVLILLFQAYFLWVEEYA